MVLQSLRQLTNSPLTEAGSSIVAIDQDILFKILTPEVPRYQFH